MLFCQKCRFNKPGGCELYPEGTAEVERMNYCNYFDEEVTFPPRGTTLTNADWDVGGTVQNGGPYIPNGEVPVGVSGYGTVERYQPESDENIDVEQLHDSVVKIERLLREVMESRKSV